MGIHGHVYSEPVDLFSDASGYAAGCVISQLQKGIQVPILYNSFLFNKGQRSYSTYKRELAIIVEFCRKHSHYFMASEPSAIHIDHMPLT